MTLSASHRKQMLLMMSTGAFAIFFTGFVHVWSIYQPYVIEVTGWSSMQAALNFYFSNCMFVIGNILGGKLQTRYHSRLVVLIGGILLSSFLLGGSPVPMYLTFGVLQGIGQGIVYGVILSVAQRWFPRRTGFASGVIVTANGLCAFFMAPFSRYMLERRGPQQALFLVGCIIAAACILACIFMVSPKDECFIRENDSDMSISKSLMEENSKSQYNSKEMIGTKSFYFMVLTMMCGLIPYYMLSPISQTILLEQGISATTAVGAVMCGSMLNAATRLVLPSIADKTGRIRCLKQFWKKEKYMKKTAEGELAHFRIWIISSVLSMDVREARIFTGSIIKTVGG